LKPEALRAIDLRKWWGPLILALVVFVDSEFEEKEFVFVKTDKY